MAVFHREIPVDVYTKLFGLLDLLLVPDHTSLNRSSTEAYSIPSPRSKDSTPLAIYLRRFLSFCSRSRRHRKPLSASPADLSWRVFLINPKIIVDRLAGLQAVRLHRATAAPARSFSLILRRRRGGLWKVEVQKFRLLLNGLIEVPAVCFVGSLPVSEDHLFQRRQAFV